MGDQIKVLRWVYVVLGLTICVLLSPLPLWRYVVAVILILWWSGTGMRINDLDRQAKREEEQADG